MRFKDVIVAAGATALLAAPVAAANPAAKLSVGSSVRASAKQGDSSKLAGVAGGWLPVIVLGVIIAASIVALENDDQSSSR